MSAKRVTIKDIARVAGLSTASVSQALRPSEKSNIKLLPDTIERIKAIADQLNYRPHAGARSIRSNSFANMGYFIAKRDLLTHSPNGYMAGVHDVAEEHFFRLTMIRLPQGIEDISNTLPSVFSENNLDAIVIESYNETADLIHKHLKDRQLPIIYLNDKHENNSVYVDDIYGAKIITEHLIEKGYKKIVYLQRESADGPTIDKMHHSARDREIGYKQTMQENGIESHVIIVHTEQTVGLYSDLHDEDWEKIKDFEAIVCYDDDLANTIGRYCYQKNIRIPEDLAMASFNGDYGSFCSWQRLTTIEIPSYAMGRDAATLAFKIINNNSITQTPSIVHRPKLTLGKTT